MLEWNVRYLNNKTNKKCCSACLFQLHVNYLEGMSCGMCDDHENVRKKIAIEILKRWRQQLVSQHALFFTVVQLSWTGYLRKPNSVSATNK